MDAKSKENKNSDNSTYANINLRNKKLMQLDNNATHSIRFNSYFTQYS